MNDGHANESIPRYKFTAIFTLEKVQFAHAVNSRKSRASLLRAELASIAMSDY